MDHSIVGMSVVDYSIISILFPLFPFRSLEAYGFIEIFSGTGWVTKQMKAEGIPTASFDMNLGDPLPNKQDAMDILSDSGFALPS